MQFFTSISCLVKLTRRCCRPTTNCFPCTLCVHAKPENKFDQNRRYSHW